MDPQSLIGPASPLGYPAPYWLMAVLKVLGFTLHATAMGLWYAGVPVALVMRWRGGRSQLLSRRLMNPMPVIIALGINFGIVPLLFLQVMYYQVFYPATILMAWPWFGVIALLLVAYYGVYVYVVGLRRDSLTKPRAAAGWAAMIAFLVIGFLFSNAMSLMANVDAWAEIWRSTSEGGAPLGTGLNTGDPSLWPRWLMMFGLSLTTVGAYLVVDGAFFARNESSAYRAWASRTAGNVYTVGLVWIAATGLWYTLGTWPAAVKDAMFGGPLLVLTIVTAVAPGLVWVLLMRGRSMVPSKGLALGVATGQFGVIALNAVSRQVVQNIELAAYLNVTGEAVDIQWSPMVLFLVLFAIGIGVIVWMLRRAVVESGQHTEGTSV